MTERPDRVIVNLAQPADADPDDIAREVRDAVEWASQPGAPWQIEFQGHRITDADLLNSDHVDAMILTGDGWGALDPWKSPLHAFSIAAVVIARTTGRDLEAVFEQIKTAPAGSLLPARRRLGEGG
jgi:hypothetical protein